MWPEFAGPWIEGLLHRGSNITESESPLGIVKYVPHIALVSAASYASYRLWQWCNTPETPAETVESLDDDDEPIEEFTGVLKLLPHQYNVGSFDENETLAVYIVLRGPILEIYYANEYIPFKELHNEPNLELTFNKIATYNLFACSIKLLPERLDKMFQWEYGYPIEVRLVEGSKLGETILDSAKLRRQQEMNSLVLFARSDRDKEAWTRRLRAAIIKNKIPPSTQDPIVSVNAVNPLNEKRPEYMHRRTQGIWLNSLLQRIINDRKTKEVLSTTIQLQVQELLNNLQFGDRLETLLRLRVHKIDLDQFTTPQIVGVASPYENDYGLWEEMLIKHTGVLKIVVEIKFNPSTFGQRDNNRPVSQNYEDSPWISRLCYFSYVPYVADFMRRTKFYIEINVDLLTGGLAFNIPKPPTDTAWLGFRDGTKVVISGTVFWGTWKLPFLYKVIDTIVEQLVTSFNRNCIIPNMLHLHLPMWRQR